MISIDTRPIELQKRYPLTISRGTQAASVNLFVTVSDGTHAGIGELSPATASEWNAERGAGQISDFVREIGLPDEFDEALIASIWQSMREFGVDPPAMAALDVALWDLVAKQQGLPLYKLFGLGMPTEPTSVTIGINLPEVIRERVPEILGRTGAKCLKIKLGTPEGLDADRANFCAAAEAARPFGVKLRVDANGGWSVAGAREMMPWLAERGADYVEQPLPEGSEGDLPQVFEGRALPIFVDESCRFPEDVAKLAYAVDGVSLKLMKCGGPTEA